MNTCESYVALLDAFAEGDLFTEDMIQVQKHLLICPDCQAYLDDLLAMQTAFPTVEDTVVPPDFTANVMAAVAKTPQETASAKPAAVRKKKTSWVRVMAPLAACCAIVVLLQSGIFGGVAKQEAASDVVHYAAAVTEEGHAEEPAAAADAPVEAVPEMEAPAAEAKIVTESASAPQASSEPKEDLQATLADQSRRYGRSITVDADYIGDLLDGHKSEVSWEINGVLELHYELSFAEYEALLAALADRNELPAEEVFESDSDMVLVIVRQN